MLPGNVDPSNRHPSTFGSRNLQMQTELSACRTPAHTGHAKWNFLPLAFLPLTCQGPLKPDAQACRLGSRAWH